MKLLQRIRQRRHITQAAAAAELGITAAALSRIERGLSKPKLPLMEKIAAYYDLPLKDVEAVFEPPDAGSETILSPAAARNVTLSSLENALMESYRSGLMAARKLSHSQELVQIPLLGETAAGYEYSAQTENTGTVIALPRELLRDSLDTYFALTVRGQSMEPELMDGDTAVIHHQNTLNNGEIGLVVYGDDVSSIGTYGTLKRVRIAPGSITLIPVNPEYKTVTISGEDLNSVQIQGRLVQVLRSY